MKTKLLSNLDKGEQAALKENFVKAKPFRDRLIEVLNEEVDSLHSSMRKEEIFNCPNWSLFQADRVAQTKALKRIISLLEESL